MASVEFVSVTTEEGFAALLIIITFYSTLVCSIESLKMQGLKSTILGDVSEVSCLVDAIGLKNKELGNAYDNPPPKHTDPSSYFKSLVKIKTIYFLCLFRIKILTRSWMK